MVNKIETETTLSGKQYLGYEGKILVKVVKNNKTLITREYHNSGMPKLFEFLAKCLGGTRSEFLRPVKIKLFKYAAADEANADRPDQFRWEEAWNLAEEGPEQVSPFIMYNATPVIRRTIAEEAETNYTISGEDYQYEVTLHFSVPSSYMSEDVIHLVGLYPNNAIDNKDDVSAYYLFTDADNNWSPLELSQVGGNFSIFIEWTLVVSNKTK